MMSCRFSEGLKSSASGEVMGMAIVVVHYRSESQVLGTGRVALFGADEVKKYQSKYIEGAVQWTRASRAMRRHRLCQRRLCQVCRIANVADAFPDK